MVEVDHTVVEDKLQDYLFVPCDACGFPNIFSEKDVTDGDHRLNGTNVNCDERGFALIMLRVAHVDTHLDLLIEPINPTPIKRTRAALASRTPVKWKVKDFNEARTVVKSNTKDVSGVRRQVSRRPRIAMVLVRPQMRTTRSYGRISR